MKGAHLYDRLFEHSHGLTVWRARKGHGTFLTLELGGRITPRSSLGDDTRGTLRLWIYLCDWTLENGDDVMLSSDSPTRDYAPTLALLVSRTLEGITPSEEPFGLALHFSRGLTLRLRADVELYDAEDDILLAFEEGHSVICCSPERGVYLSE